MVQDEQPDGDAKFIRLFLLNGDYDVEVALSLDVTNSGGLAPSFTYTNPITAATSFTLVAGRPLVKAGTIRLPKTSSFHCARSIKRGTKATPRLTAHKPIPTWRVP